MLRPYTTDPEELEDDLIRSSLLVMPSRAEGFGLVGEEAIKAGTPVLVSESSGLGTLLRDTRTDEQAAAWGVPMTGDTATDVETSASNWPERSPYTRGRQTAHRDGLLNPRG